jgi:hypothetical protein
MIPEKLQNMILEGRAKYAAFNFDIDVYNIQPSRRGQTIAVVGVDIYLGTNAPLGSSSWINCAVQAGGQRIHKVCGLNFYQATIPNTDTGTKFSAYYEWRPLLLTDQPINITIGWLSQNATVNQATVPPAPWELPRPGGYGDGPNNVIRRRQTTSSGPARWYTATPADRANLDAASMAQLDSMTPIANTFSTSNYLVVVHTVIIEEGTSNFNDALTR